MDAANPTGQEVAQPGSRAKDGAVPSLRRKSSGWLRFDHLVMAAAVLCLIVLVVLPICYLLIGSVRSEDGFTFDFFREAFSGRLYLQALGNSLVLGSFTALFSVIIGLPLAWGVYRTLLSAAKFFH